MLEPLALSSTVACCRWSNVTRFKSKQGGGRCLFKATYTGTDEDTSKRPKKECVLKFVSELDVRPLDAWQAEGLLPPDFWKEECDATTCCPNVPSFTRSEQILTVMTVNAVIEFISYLSITSASMPSTYTCACAQCLSLPLPARGSSGQGHRRWPLPAGVAAIGGGARECGIASPSHAMKHSRSGAHDPSSPKSADAF